MDNNVYLNEENNTNDIKTDHDSEELSPVLKKRRKEIEHLNFILPTRKSIRKIVAEFSLTFYKDMTKYSQCKCQSSDSVIHIMISWECDA